MNKHIIVLLITSSLCANASYHSVPTAYGDKISIKEINHVHSTSFNGGSSSHTTESNQYLSPLDALDLGVRTGNKSIVRLALQKLEQKNEKIDAIPALIVIGSQMKESRSSKKVGYWLCGILGGIGGALIWRSNSCSFSSSYEMEYRPDFFGFSHFTPRWRTPNQNSAECLAEGIILISFSSIVALANYFSFEGISNRYTDTIQLVLDSPICYISSIPKARCELKYISTFLTNADKDRIDIFLEKI